MPPAARARRRLSGDSRPQLSDRAQLDLLLPTSHRLEHSSPRSATPIRGEFCTRIQTLDFCTLQLSVFRDPTASRLTLAS